MVYVDAAEGFEVVGMQRKASVREVVVVASYCLQYELGVEE